MKKNKRQVFELSLEDWQFIVRASLACKNKELSYEDLIDMWEQLGTKYGFDQKTIRVNSKLPDHYIFAYPKAHK